MDFEVETPEFTRWGGGSTVANLGRIPTTVDCGPLRPSHAEGVCLSPPPGRETIRKTAETKRTRCAAFGYVTRGQATIVLGPLLACRRVQCPAAGGLGELVRSPMPAWESIRGRECAFLGVELRGISMQMRQPVFSLGEFSDGLTRERLFIVVGFGRFWRLVANRPECRKRNIGSACQPPGVF